LKKVIYLLIVYHSIIIVWYKPLKLLFHVREGKCSRG
jgi:hypothetical protein